MSDRPLLQGSATEYGIVYRRSPDELHRGPMTEAEAKQWIKEFKEDGGRPDAFLVVCRYIGPWELA